MIAYSSLVEGEADAARAAACDGRGRADRVGRAGGRGAAAAAVAAETACRASSPAMLAPYFVPLHVDRDEPGLLLGLEDLLPRSLGPGGEVGEGARDRS